MKVLLTGASGKLGGSILEQNSSLDLIGLCRTPPPRRFGAAILTLDLAAPLPLDDLKPDLVVHTAALSAVSDCQANPELADRINHQATRALAQWCQRNQRPLIYVSSDMVFDGEAAPYDESALPGPLSHYGRSKWAGEQAVLEIPRGLVVRAALMVGPNPSAHRSFYDVIVERLRQGQVCPLFQDEWRGMLSYQSAAQALLQLCQGPLDRSGLLHLAGPRRSRFELGQLIGEVLGCPERVQAGWRSDHPSPEPRPRDLSLTSRYCRQWLPDWQADSLEEQLPGWLS